MGRQHPGESPASLMFEGILQFFTSNYKEPDYLKNKFTFILIPMVNEEGVFLGNYRTGIGGFDFNRIWDFPDSATHDTIFILKKFIKE